MPILLALHLAVSLVSGLSTGLVHASPPLPDPAQSTAERNATRLGFDPSLVPSEDDPIAELGLRAQHDGGMLYVDPHARFTARFNPDGTVDFADRWKRPDARKPDKGRCCRLPVGGFNPLYLGMRGPVEWLLLAQGKDVLAREKAELLERTRPLRIRQAIAFTKRLLGERLDSLDDELRAVAADPDRDPPERRTHVFERWDECDERFVVTPEGIPEEAISEIDAERVRVATLARRRIEAFVRSQFPQESRRAFSRGELRALNDRRVSVEAFEPYNEVRRAVAAGGTKRPEPPQSRSDPHDKVTP